MERTPDTASNTYGTLIRITTHGEVSSRNLCGSPVNVEVTRYLFELVEETKLLGKVEQVNLFEDEGFLGEDRPFWRSHHS